MTGAADSFHTPVMPAEVLSILLDGLEGQELVIFDGTLGMGGHATRLLSALGDRVKVYIGVDRDGEALRLARERLEHRGNRVRFIQARHDEVRNILADVGCESYDLGLLDLGASSVQLDSEDRGFSFRADAPLDMRMDRSRGPTAADLLRRWEARELGSILRNYGEVPGARQLARRLLEHRHRLHTTRDLADAVLEATPRSGSKPRKHHPATLVFQALRIAVNDELGGLERALPEMLDLLAPGGRLAVLSFHSLEDRRVKEAFSRAARDCLCPPGLPICRCGHRATVRLLTRRPRKATPDEVFRNPRARSARLRAVERL